MEENKTTINMEFVDEPTEDEQDNVPVPTQEPPKPEEVKEEKPGFFKTVWNGITFVPRWAYRKIKESPAAGAIGMIAGAGIGVGAKVLYDRYGHRNPGGDDFIPADQPEIEIPDYGEDYVNSDESTTYTTEE